MGRKGRVLVVDEDPVIRLAIDRQLDVLGWDAILVNNGAEAARVVELGIPLDALLVNLQLPDGDGRAVASAITARMPRVRVVLMGAELRDEPIAQPHRFLVQPFSTASLAGALGAAVPERTSLVIRLIPKP